MKCIEAAKLSGVDQTGLHWMQCVLSLLHFITINNHLYLFTQDWNFSFYSLHIISFDLTKLMCGTKVSNITVRPNLVLELWPPM